MNPSFFDKATALQSIPLIRAAIKFSGIQCLVYKRRESVEKDDDLVYGVYGGDKLIEEVTSDNDLNNVYGVMSVDQLDDIEGIEPDKDGIVKLVSSKDDFDSLGGDDPVEIKILMPSSQWRVSSFNEFGNYEVDGYAWTLENDVLESGDVIVINRPNGGITKYKVTLVETVGTLELIATKFKLASLG